MRSVTLNPSSPSTSLTRMITRLVAVTTFFSFFQNLHWHIKSFHLTIADQVTGQSWRKPRQHILYAYNASRLTPFNMFGSCVCVHVCIYVRTSGSRAMGPSCTKHMVRIAAALCVRFDATRRYVLDVAYPEQREEGNPKGIL